MQSDFLDLARVNHVINNYETEFSLFLSLSLSLSLSLYVCLSFHNNYIQTAVLSRETAAKCVSFAVILLCG